jgi:hypothetical protein
MVLSAEHLLAIRVQKRTDPGPVLISLARNKSGQTRSVEFLV